MVVLKMMRIEGRWASVFWYTRSFMGTEYALSRVSEAATTRARSRVWFEDWMKTVDPALRPNVEALATPEDAVLPSFAKMESVEGQFSRMTTGVLEETSHTLGFPSNFNIRKSFQEIAAE